MLKLTFTLAAALYAGFVIWGEPDADFAAVDAGEPAIGNQIANSAPIILETSASSRAQVTRGETALPDPSAIAAAAPAPVIDETSTIGEPARISLIETAAPAPAEFAEPEAAVEEGGSDLMQVTGSRVNLRSGPSTGNAVVDSLVRGTLVEPLGEPVNGWVELRDVATGTTGFMSARFIEPAG